MIVQQPRSTTGISLLSLAGRLPELRFCFKCIVGWQPNSLRELNIIGQDVWATSHPPHLSRPLCAQPCHFDVQGTPPLIDLLTQGLATLASQGTQPDPSAKWPMWGPEVVSPSISNSGKPFKVFWTLHACFTPHELFSWPTSCGTGATNALAPVLRPCCGSCGPV